MYPPFRQLRLLVVAVVLPVCSAAGVRSATPCPNSCSGNGYCLQHGISTCICNNNWRGFDCSERTCPTWKPWSGVPSADETAHTWDQATECANMGACDRATGVCRCSAGFTGEACQIMDCPKGPNAQTCSGNGRCLPMGEAAEYQDMVTLANSYAYDLWDGDMIHGCVCDDGFQGYDCSERVCPVGDDPLTVAQRNEVQVLDCQCSNGCVAEFTLSYKGYTTAPIAATDSGATLTTRLLELPSIHGVTVSLSSGGTALCPNSGESTSVTFTHNPGNLWPLLVAKTDAAGEMDAFAHDGDGSAGQYGSQPEAVDGTREAIECAGRGVCDHTTGWCQCFKDFESSDGAGASGSLGDCGYYASDNPPLPKQHCPRKNSLWPFFALNVARAGDVCWGHGVCSYTTSYVCTCEEGYTGRYCQHRECATGRAWFDEASGVDTAHSAGYTCSNRGHCNTKSGVCACDRLFEGPACNHLQCPKLYAKAPFRECSGHGSCYMMQDLAKHAKSVAGDTSGFSYDAEWDATMVQGCHCDAVYGWKSDGSTTYEGFDCTEVPCPVGADPHATTEVSEQQFVDCEAVGGTFKLTFEGYTTSDISYAATANEVKLELESLKSVGLVSVVVAATYSHDSSKCLVDAAVDTGCCATSPSMSCADDYRLTKGAGCGSGKLSFTCLPPEQACDAGFTVTFQSNYGALQTLVPTDGLTGAPVATLTATQTVPGTRVGYECSNHGVCNRQTGECACHAGYCSSDGQHGLGTRGDCGFVSNMCKGG